MTKIKFDELQRNIGKLKNMTTPTYSPLDEIQRLESDNEILRNELNRLKLIIKGLREKETK